MKIIILLSKNILSDSCRLIFIHRRVVHIFGAKIILLQKSAQISVAAAAAASQVFLMLLSQVIKIVLMVLCHFVPK
jgi:hypothetical protein